MHHNKKQEKALKTMGIICLVNECCWENFAYMYYHALNIHFYFGTTTVFICLTTSNTNKIGAKTISRRREVPMKLTKDRKKPEEHAGHDYRTPRRDGRGCVRDGERRKF